MKRYFQTNAQKLSFALTAMQIMCVLVLIMGTAAAVILARAGFVEVTLGLAIPELGDRPLIFPGLLGLITVITTSVCSYRGIISFMRMCGRLKTQRAFTAENGQSLRLIGRMSVISAAVIAVLPQVMMCILTSQPQKAFGIMASVLSPLLLLALVYLGVGVVCFALRGLLLRAMAMQEENDLTV